MKEVTVYFLILLIYGMPFKSFTRELYFKVNPKKFINLASHVDGILSYTNKGLNLIQKGKILFKVHNISSSFNSSSFKAPFKGILNIRKFQGDYLKKGEVFGSFYHPNEWRLNALISEEEVIYFQKNKKIMLDKKKNIFATVISIRPRINNYLKVYNLELEIKSSDMSINKMVVFSLEDEAIKKSSKK